MSDAIYASIGEIHSLYREKKLTVRELALALLSRIAEIDKSPGGINSVLEINPDVLFIADELDRKLHNGEDLPALFGIPILLKDNINTADKLHTSAGSIALADNYAPCDAPIVTALREAGTLILGKANMTEFANYMSSDGMPSGYSSRGGQVVNPFNRSITPSGSSSGSAVAAAAGLCTVSIGTETSGSIISPASHNGITGIKPTGGLVERSGIIPISNTLDTAGPMARTVRDAAVLLGVMAGKDYTGNCVKDGLKGIRAGINRYKKPGDTETTDEEIASFNNLCRLISDAGAILIENINFEPGAFAGKIMLYEFKTCMNHYLSTLGGSSPIHTLGDIIKYNQAHAAAALAYGQSRLLDAENNASGTLTEGEYIKALNEREKAISALDRLFEENRLDIILCERPTNIAPFTGFPSMTIPLGQRKDGLPIGSYWIARRFDEATIIKTAFVAEQILGLNLRPDFRREN